MFCIKASALILLLFVLPRSLESSFCKTWLDCKWWKGEKCSRRQNPQVHVLGFAFSMVQAQNYEDGYIGDTSRIALEPDCDRCKVHIGAKKVILKGDTSAVSTDLDDTLMDYPLLLQPHRGPWYNEREQSATKDFVTWTFKVGANKDAFICFGRFHVPRKVQTTGDATACDANQDRVVVKDGADTLLTCCGTQCHGKLYKLARQPSEKTYTAVLTIGSKDTYNGDARWNDPSGTLCAYLGIDIVELQVSTFKFTIEDAQISTKSGYISLPRTEFNSATHEWRNYIDTAGTANNADAATCERACTAADKKCNFFIWATVSGSTRCYFGRFARDARTPINDTGLESGADIQNGIWYNGVVKLKRGALGVWLDCNWSNKQKCPRHQVSSYPTRSYDVCA